MIDFQVRDRGAFRFVFFKLADGADPAVVSRKIDEVKEAFNGAFTVIFRGAGPCWLYAMLTHAAHATEAVACFQPRLGYVVVTSHAGRLAAGHILSDEDIGLTVAGDRIVGGEEVKLHRQLVISVGGPPHSGKSVFLNELYVQLRAEMSSDVFLLRACPDGEGTWMYDADPATAQKVRQKGKFGEAFTESIRGAVANLRKGFMIVLIDLGGKLLPPNDEMLSSSTHHIVLSSDKEATKQWVAYGEGYGATTLAVLDSELVKDDGGTLDPNARSEVVIAETLPIRGVLRNLDRAGPRDPYQEAVRKLADWMLQAVQ